MYQVLIEKLLFWCGIGHIVLCIGSLAIPRALHWNKHLSHLNPMLRQMFWTYAAYILTINLTFGLVSVFGTQALLNHSFLAKSITLFIGLYWLARIAVQFFYFDKSDAPKGLPYTLAEVGLVALFVIFTITYLLAFSFNRSWI
jgi:hypothetical protein